MAPFLCLVSSRAWFRGRGQVLPLTAALAMGLSGAGCGSDPGPTARPCLPEYTTACTPDINTNFESIYSNLLSKRCGTSGNACHGTDGRKDDLLLSDADSAYKALLGQDGTHARVIPGDPSCSVLMERLESDDQAWRMPYMEVNKLPDGLRCAVRTWIQDGAAR